jgi:hypothetical protein
MVMRVDPGSVPMAFAPRHAGSRGLVADSNSKSHADPCRDEAGDLAIAVPVAFGRHVASGAGEDKQHVSTNRAISALLQPLEAVARSLATHPD